MFISGIISFLVQYDYLKFVYSEAETKFTFFEFYIIGTLLTSIISGILLWKLKKTGWYLTLILCLSCIIYSLHSIVTFEYVDNYIPFIVPIIIFLSIFYYLVLKNQRALFNIKKENVYNFFLILIGLICVFIFIDTIRINN